MDWGAEDDYEAATYNRRQALTEPKEPKTFTIPGPEPEVGIDLLISTNKKWFLSRDNADWVLEHQERGIIEAGPVPWDDLRYAYCGDMQVATISKSQLERALAATWEPEDGPPPPRVGTIQLLDQDVWWLTKDKRAIQVADMETGHIRNLIGFLQRRADQLKQRYELSIIRGPQPSGDAATDCFDDAMSHLFDQPADKWIEEFPLMQKLHATLSEREGGE